MKIIDTHIHASATTPEPQRLLSELEDAGVWGCGILSNRPKEMTADIGTDFDTRLAEVLGWAKGYEDRIFPILWIHPDEEGICEKVKIAAKAGISAFKVICNNFFVGDTKSMDMLASIAEEGKPVLFHSGILWDGAPSSMYNRPANWEALLDLPSLRFALAHCSWPWIDECIAMYGKFLNAKSAGRSTEMFLDLTPGTPEIYREELFRKLFTIGYDVPNNILYGTDGSAERYNGAWTRKWLAIDTALFDKYGIPQKMREKIFYRNYMRFLGKETGDVNYFVPTPDNQTAWTPALEE